MYRPMLLCFSHLSHIAWPSLVYITHVMMYDLVRIDITYRLGLVKLEVRLHI